MSSWTLHLVRYLGDVRALCGQRAAYGCTDKESVATCVRCLAIAKAGRKT